MNELTHLDLFTGIGGFKFAAEWAGFRTVGFSEVEPYACRVLAERYPDVPNIGDVRITANFARFRGATLLTGGFPCQPWSLAGKRRGASDDRHLWPAMLRVIETVRPAWIIGENVPGLIGLALDSCCADLESRGYAVQPFVVPACAVDAPHRRDRVWIVAYADEGGIRRTGTQRESGHASLRCEAMADAERFGRQRGRTASGKANRASGEITRYGEDVAHPSRAGREERDASAIAEGTRHATRGDDSNGLFWLPEPGVGRVADGIPNRAHRLKGLGNAIVPQAAYRYARWIAQIERGEVR